MSRGPKLSNRQHRATHDIPMGEHTRRLDSWKEIAEYLGRDVRTAMRWAKSHGLTVRRVGGKRRSVFAFTNEIDGWLEGRAAAEPTPQPPVSPAVPARQSTPRYRAAMAAAALIAA